MSYFMTVTGQMPQIMNVEGVSLIAAQQTQVVKIVARFLSPDKAKETYLVADETGNTSHNLVSDAVDSFISNTPIKETRLLKVLDACFNVSCTILIWWAPLDRDDLVKFDDKEAFRKHVINCLAENKDINAYYVPKIAQ